MTRDDFMAFFRRDDFHELISESDAEEIFLNVLHGSSDIDGKLIEDLYRNYGIEEVEA
jgi:hypothetical protein